MSGPNRSRRVVNVLVLLASIGLLILLASCASRSVDPDNGCLVPSASC